MKVADGTISVEVQTHVIARATDKLKQIVDLRNVRGISLFFGLGTTPARALTPANSSSAVDENLPVMGMTLPC